VAIDEGPKHRLVIEGASASVRLGYTKIATLGAWRVEGDVFSAVVVTVDGFRITQPGLVLEIDNRDGIPTRRALGAVVVSGDRVSARLLKRSEP
jgi:hypothetical protein